MSDEISHLISSDAAVSQNLTKEYLSSLSCEELGRPSPSILTWSPISLKRWRTLHIEWFGPSSLVTSRVPVFPNNVPFLWKCYGPVTVALTQMPDWSHWKLNSFKIKYKIQQTNDGKRITEKNSECNKMNFSLNEINHYKNKQNIIYNLFWLRQLLNY